jgi:hypothetical protein
VIHAEEEKRRRERENYHITSVPILSRAAYEPSLYHGPPEEHDDGNKSPLGQNLTPCFSPSSEGPLFAPVFF